MLVSGVGFFTDAYDLFVISTVATLVASPVGPEHDRRPAGSPGSAILGAFFGALVFGRLADVFGRKKVYTIVAAIMIVGALASAVRPGLPLAGGRPVSFSGSASAATTRSRPS